MQEQINGLLIDNYWALNPTSTQRYNVRLLMGL